MAEDEIADRVIPLKNGTRERLREFCGKGRTYDEAINELLDRVTGVKAKQIQAPPPYAGTVPPRRRDMLHQERF